MAQPAQEWECSSIRNGVIHVNIKLNVSTWIDLELFAIGFDLMGEKNQEEKTGVSFPPSFPRSARIHGKWTTAYIL